MHLWPFYTADDTQDEVAAGALLAGAQPRIRALLRRKGVRDEDREDLCQESVIRLLRALRGSRAPGSRPILDWDKLVVTITLNVFRDFWRRARLRDRVSSIEEIAEGGGDLPASPEDVASAVASALSAETLREQLWRKIAALPPLQLAALLLHLEQDDLLRLQGRKSAIAEALGIPISEFREVVWPALPLSDRQIAERLKVVAGKSTSAEKRVSNFRLCAQKRLERFLLRLKSQEHLP